MWESNRMNMWKTVSARIRGAATEIEAMGEDTEGMVESTSKLREQIMAMTGFDIMKDENTFKDMREIMVGIGKEWENLSDIDQAALLEKLAGKNHANTLAAALSQYEMIEDVYQTAENSEGSALEEQAEYMKSLQYSIDKGKATVQEFWSTLLDSGFLKSALDFGTKALDIFTELIDTLGTVPTLLTTTLPLLQNAKFFPKDFRLTYVTCHGILVPYYI